MQTDRKTDNRPDGSSSAFKVGAISLAFLIIGYQSALFVSRASILRIEADRDRPDTVYVVREAAETAAPYETAAPQETLRRTAPHSEKVAAIRNATRRIESFRFNPNTVSEEDLRRLGFSEKQAQSIVNYRLKGGRFRRKSDFAKSFVVADSVYRRLEAYIDIPLVDINRADSAAFDQLPGIGPYFAARMVSYREELGGYSCKEQLMDIYRFDREKFDALSDLITCSPPEKAFELWALPEEDLRRHPCIRNWSTAHSIVLYRESMPKDALTVDGLLKAGILTEEQAERLSRCLISPP